MRLALSTPTVSAGTTFVAPVHAPAPGLDPAPVPQVPTAPSEQETLLMERVSSAKTMEHIKLLNTTPRVWKSPGYAAAAEYVVAQLIAAGWDARIEERESSGMWGAKGIVKNVVAERKGTAADGERKLVIAGAHLDSVPRGPGANDNASGSGTLIEIARSLAGIDTRNDIRFVWFDGEEAGLLGSSAYAKNMSKEERERSVAMINMDMVGSQNGDIGFGLGMKSGNAMGDAIKGVALRTGSAAVLRAERHSRSDHASFDNVGIPALDFGVAVKTLNHDDPFYHSPQDTLDKINPQVLEGYGDLIAVTVLELANRSARYQG